MNILKNLDFKHGGNIYEFAEKFKLPISDIIDASASIVPFVIPDFLKDELYVAIKNESFRYYPERNLNKFRTNRIF